MDDKIVQLQEFINNSKYTIVITGAGISTSSGIKDMEHMNTFQVIQTSLEALVRARPEHSYKLLKKSFLKAIFVTGPTPTHRKLAELEQKGKVQGVITTNIDCLHKIAGSKKVAEIQGSYGFNRCSKCGQQYNNVNIWNEGKAPRCKSCNGIIVSHPVYTHIGVYEEDYKTAIKWISQAELVVVVGSKGMYGGYFGYINPNAVIVQVNPKKTQFDNLVVLNISRNADEVFQQLS